MISIKEIKQMTETTTYNRGALVYNNNQVTEIHIEEDEYGDEEITAVVKGSGRNRYEVYVRVDPLQETIQEADCDCPAFATYSGLCKHCVAVLLKYNARTSQTSSFLNYLEENNGERKPYQANAVKTVQMRSTPELERLLEKRTMDRTMPLLQADIYGKVRIQTIMECTGEGATLEFKLGITQMYVMKDVFEFVRNVKNHAEHKYGKNLQFVHSLEAFQDEYKPLVKFLIQWADANMDAYRPTSYYGYYMQSTMPKSRYVSLVGSTMEEYLFLQKGKSFEAYVAGMRETRWQITEEPLPRQMQIQRKDKGIEISLKRFWGYRLERYYVYFHKGLVYMEPMEKLEPINDFIMTMGQMNDGKAYLAEKDIPAFCNNLLPSLEQFYEIKRIDFDESNYGVETPEFKIYLDAPQENMITCHPMAVYGENRYSLYGKEKLSSRNIEAEASVRNLVGSYCNAFDEKTNNMVAIDDEEVIYELLVDGIPAMQNIAEVFVSDAIKKMEVREAPKITVGVSITGNLMELTLAAGDMPKDELIELLSKYHQKKKFYRLKNGSFINAGESGLEALAELKSGLQITDKQLMQDTVKLQKYRALYLDAQLKENPVITATRQETFRSLIRNMKTVEDNDFEVPASLNDILREYQRNGYLWIRTLKQNGFGGILADDMGLGKTLQVICFLLSEHQMAQPEKRSSKEHKAALIVSPASLVYNWSEEIKKFAPELTTVMVIGSAEERSELLQSAGPEDILITSYDLLKRDVEIYTRYTFSNEIIDEAQFIKNHNTQAAKAVKLMNADFKLALTGTPVENRLSELWSIFDYLMPGFLYGYQKFREEIEIPVVRNGDEGATARLQKMIRPFVLRRLKKDVLRDLPDKLEENMYVKMEGEQQKLYDAHVQKIKLLLDKQSGEEFKSSKIILLAELTKLRQLCCDPALLYEDYKGESAKTDMCVNLIQNAVENGHKILLFSQFTTMLERLTMALKKEKIRYMVLTGATSKEKRARMVADFNNDDTSVFCISLKAGGTGLNLTAADVVIHYDPWWNLAVQNQATDRAHRIGQKHAVNVYKLIAKGSIEENIVKLQEKKRMLADQILGGEGMGAGSFTREELLELLES